MFTEQDKKQLSEAVEEGNITKLKKLIKKIEKQEQAEKQLFEAVGKGDITELKELIEKNGADVNAQDKDGWTALRYVVQGYYNNLELIKTLLECENIDVNVPDKNGLTPLRLAVQCDRKEASQLIIQHLVEKKADKPDYLEGEYSTYWNNKVDRLLTTDPDSNLHTTGVEARQQREEQCSIL